MEKLINTPLESAEEAIATGAMKAGKPAAKTLLLGIMAGMFLSFGCMAYMIIAGSTADPGVAKFLGGAIFPVGLIMIILGGGELFTGNNLMTLGLMERRFSSAQMMKNWGLVWTGNLIGSLFVAFLVVGSGMMADPHQASGLTAAGEFAVALATKKVSIGFIPLLLKGVLCNLLVAMAVLLSGAARDVVGKVALMWFPIAAFVVAGYEHCVANMMYIPTAMLLGAHITVPQFFINNLLPVTIGNIIGGGIILPALYWFLYVRESGAGQAVEIKGSEGRNAPERRYSIFPKATA